MNPLPSFPPVDGSGADASALEEEQSSFLDFLKSAVIESMKTRTPDEALRIGLAQVGADVGWPFGHLWVRDPTLPETLISSGLFHSMEPERFEPFRRATEAAWFPRGTGLPGRVLEEGRAIWFNQITTHPDLSRKEAARIVGLNTAFAFPVRVNDQIAAVVELFTTREEPPNAPLLDIVEHVGSHLGGLIEQAWDRRGGISTHSSNFYLAMLENFPFLVWRGGPDGRRNYFNRTWLNFTGRSRRDEEGGGWLEAVHPGDRERVARICVRAATDGIPFTVDYRLRRHDGETRWMNDVARPFKGAHGELFGYIGSCYDVTSRYGVLEELHDHRTRLRVLSRRLMEMQEIEHRRIARGLHDEIGQSLAGVRMSLQAIQAGHEVPEGQGDEIVRSIDMLDQCIQSVRTLALDLRPPDLDDLGLIPAVRAYLDRQVRAAGIPIRLDSGGALDTLPEELETTSFRVIQEAVTNAVRHSGADSIQVSIRRTPGWLVIRVFDDGRGFDRSRLSETAGAGLFGMEERVSLLEGELTVDATPDKGTGVVARFPFVENIDDA